MDLRLPAEEGEIMCTTQYPPILPGLLLCCYFSNVEMILILSPKTCLPNSILGYVMDDFPCLSEEFMSIKDQLELIKSWKLKPDFLINLRVSYSLYSLF